MRDLFVSDSSSTAKRTSSGAVRSEQRAQAGAPVIKATPADGHARERQFWPEVQRFT